MPRAESHPGLACPALAGVDGMGGGAAHRAPHVAAHSAQVRLRTLPSAHAHSALLRPHYNAPHEGRYGDQCWLWAS